MLAASRYALSRGVEIQINWPGRLGVAPIGGAPFLRDGRGALAGADHVVCGGWRSALVSAALYVRRGAREIRARDPRKERPKLSS